MDHIIIGSGPKWTVLIGKTRRSLRPTFGPFRPSTCIHDRSLSHFGTVLFDPSPIRTVNFQRRPSTLDWTHKNYHKICSWIAQRRTVWICPPLRNYFCVALNFVHIFANLERFNFVHINFEFSFVQTSCSSWKNFFSSITLWNQKVNGQNSTKNLKINYLSNWTIKKFLCGLNASWCMVVNLLVHRI